MTYTTPTDQPAGQPGADTGLSLKEFTQYLLEIENQPAWSCLLYTSPSPRD